MSLPPKAVPKPAAAAAAGTGPGTGPSPSSQLRTTLTTVPGTSVAQQPVPQTPYPSLKAYCSTTNMCVVVFPPQTYRPACPDSISEYLMDSIWCPKLLSIVQAGGSLGFFSARVLYCASAECQHSKTKCLVRLKFLVHGGSSAVVTVFMWLWKAELSTQPVWTDPAGPSR